MNKSLLEKKIKTIFWDYNCDNEEIFSILNEEKKSSKWLNKQKIFLRMLETLTWYDILAILGIDYIKTNLSSEIIKTIKNDSLRERYEYLRQLLQGETVPSTEWSVEFSKKIRSSLLSDRWYSSK